MQINQKDIQQKNGDMSMKNNGGYLKVRLHSMYC